MKAARRSRREFLGTAASGALVVFFRLPRARAAALSSPFAPSAHLRIGADGVVTVVTGRSEMGQGAHTAIAMLLAEELGADYSTLAVEMGGLDRAFVLKGDFGQQVTGGSETTTRSYEPVRVAGAQAREMLISAAARTWGVDRSTCRAEKSAIISGDKRATFGELAPLASKEHAPSHPRLKDPKDWTLLGTRAARPDLPAKTDGSAVFGIDVKRPGMKYAMVARCPVLGGTLASFDAKAALAIPGVEQVFAIENGGVAVVANSTHTAWKGREALLVKWNEGALASLDSAQIRAQFAEAAKKKGRSARDDGNARKAIARAPKERRVEAVYETPFLAHATMEPLVCTADVREASCEVWGPIQNQTGALGAAKKYSHLPKAAIRIHTTLLGGGFGRRLEWDHVEEAVQISKIAKAPVKVQWTRDDDMTHDFYRPASRHEMSAALGADGMPVAWHHHIVSPSIVGRLIPIAAKIIIDPTSVDGAESLPYAIGNLRVSYVRHEPGVPVGPWRSVGNSQNAFAIEAFLDELAAAGGKDPVELRRALLAKSARHLAVLERVVKESGWTTPLPEGRARGIAVHGSFGSVVGTVLEISKPADAIRVERVVSVIDCGRAINPDQVEAQVQSATVFGLSAALHGAITVSKGRIEQVNFDGYPPLRMKEMPKIEVHIMDSTRDPSGVGEPGVPPIAPALANAIFALTKTRIRALPVDAA